MPPILWTFATGWRRVNLVFFGVAALVAASFGLVHLGSSRITEAAPASRLQMPAKKTAASKAAAAASGANDARVDALCRLQAADSDWWDGIEVTVPWAAVSAATVASGAGLMNGVSGHWTPGSCSPIQVLSTVAGGASLR